LHSLLTQKSDVHSQNGEDGVIAAIVEQTNTTTRWCCEFGAWDGEHLSNTKLLAEKGWRRVLIEASPERYRELERKIEPGAIPIHATVHPGDLELLLDPYPDLDLLVIDIDGLDYLIFRDLRMRPRLICVEVNAGHSPVAAELPEEVAAVNVGQPLNVFCEDARRLGYRLVAYTGNAFFVREDVQGPPGLSPTDAYEEFLKHLSPDERSWLWLVNQGFVDPLRKFSNPWLSRRRLGLSRASLALSTCAAVMKMRVPIRAFRLHRY
jgi:hypothetical protein